MPVTYVHIEWPNEETDQLYSPSSVIVNYFTPGSQLTINEFMNTTDKALTEASKRVRAKFGYGCTSAEAENIRVSAKSKHYEAAQVVKIISIK